MNTLKIPTLLLSALLAAGCAGTGKKPEPAKPAELDLVQGMASGNAGYPREHAPGGFYVALRAVPQWKQKAENECLDDSVLAGLRRYFRTDAAQIALVAAIRWEGLAEPLRLPLFVVGKNENPPAGQPGCFSEVVDRKLTPWLRADKNTAFTLDFEVYSSSSSNFKLAEQLVSLGSEALSLSSGSAWLVEKLAGKRFQEASKRISEALAGGWSASSSDKYHTALQVFPDNAGWSGHRDAYRFNLGPLVADLSGLKLDGAVPTMTVEMVYADSLFGHDGHYPQDPATVLSTSMGSEQSELTLNALLAKGINNVTREYLRTASDQAQMENYCTALREEFGKQLNPGDALVARYSAVKLHSYYDRSRELRSAKCFDEAELERLTGLGYAFANLDRQLAKNREAEIKALLDPLVKAIKSADAAQIQQAFANLARLETWEGAALPAREDGWSADNGEAAWQRLQAVGAAGARLGCYQAAPDAALNLLGLVALIDGKPSGWGIYFENGQAREITIADPAKIRRFARLPESWMAECPLL